MQGVPENRIKSLKTLTYQIKGTSRSRGSKYSDSMDQVLEGNSHRLMKYERNGK